MSQVPYTKYKQLSGPSGSVVLIDSVQGNREVPKKKPLPPSSFYSREVATIQHLLNERISPRSCNSADTGSAVINGSTFPGMMSGCRDAASNRALARLRGRVGKTASLGTALAESRQSIELISNRAQTLADAFKAIRRKDPKALRRLLQLPRGTSTSKKRWASNRASDTWLEYWFGWAPLIGDIHDSVETLQGPLPPQRVSGMSTERDSRRLYTFTDLGQGNYHRQEINYSVSCRVKAWAEVKISNPNLYLANQLGLVNPATIAWELVPFSFVIDWFVPVNRFLESFTDFTGCEITGSGTSVSRRAEGNYDFAYVYKEFGTVYQQLEKFGSVAWRASRSSGLPSYIPVGFRLPSRLSVTRAATSVSLLVKLFLPFRG